MLSDGPDALVVGEAVALDVRPAGFVLRAAGAAIDVIASLVVGLLLVLLIGRLAGAGLLDDASSAACAIAAVVLAIVVLPVVVEVASRGRSLDDEVRQAGSGRSLRDAPGELRPLARRREEGVGARGLERPEVLPVLAIRRGERGGVGDPRGPHHDAVREHRTLVGAGRGSTHARGRTWRSGRASTGGMARSAMSRAYQSALSFGVRSCVA